MALVELGREYIHVFVRVTNWCDGEGPNVYVYFTRVRAVAAAEAEPADLSDYLIVKE